MGFLEDVWNFLRPFKPYEEPPKKVPDPVEIVVAPKKPSRTVRKTTIAGRVVYNRKRHFVDLKAVKRFLRAYLEEDLGITTDSHAFHRDLMDVFEVLTDISVKYLTPEEIHGLIDAITALFPQKKD